MNLGPQFSTGFYTSYDTFTSFPSAPPDGSLALAQDTGVLYGYLDQDLTWHPLGAPSAAIAVGAIDTGLPSANAAKLDGLGNFYMQSASATVPGVVNNTTQSFSGNKTFTGTLGASNLSGTNTGDVTLGNVGSTPANAGASLSGQVLTLQPADATHGGVVSTTTQTFAGAKTFSSAPTLSSLTATTVPYLDGSKILVSSAVTPTELGYLSGVTSALQTQLAKALSGNISGEILPVENRTYVLELSVSEARTLNSLTIQLGSGTCTASVQINAVSVTGLAALSITTALQSFSATALNTVVATDKITLVVSAQVGASDLSFSLKYTK